MTANFSDLIEGLLYDLKTDDEVTYVGFSGNPANAFIVGVTPHFYRLSAYKGDKTETILKAKHSVKKSHRVLHGDRSNV